MSDPRISLPLIDRVWRSPQARHGWQLVAAVLVAYGVSSALGLPESLWAVMSALIVVRPTTGSTFGAGWERVQGTVLGTVFALGGVWLHQVGWATTAVTMGVVGALAFGSALVPSLRSAPIAALIVLGSAGVAGHSALQVAALRVMEISVGVATGLVISMLGGGAARAANSFDAACAAILRRLASDVTAALAPSPPDAPTLGAREREAAADEARLELRRLALLADAADREHRLFRWRRRRSERDAEPTTTATTTTATATTNQPPQRHRAAARLMARTSHDVGVFARLASPSGGAEQRALLADLARAAAHALASTADALEGRGEPDLAPLKQVARSGAAGAPWIAAATKLLSQDLIALARLRSTSTSTRTPSQTPAPQ